jgi:hypothetical protein
VHLVLHDTSEPIVESLRRDIAVIRREVYPSDLVPDRKGCKEADDAGTHPESSGFLDHIEVLQVQQTPQVPTGPQDCYACDADILPSCIPREHETRAFMAGNRLFHDPAIIGLGSELLARTVMTIHAPHQ